MSQYKQLNCNLLRLLRDMFSSLRLEFSTATRAQSRPLSGADTKMLPSLGDISSPESPTVAYLFIVRSELDEKNPPNLGEPSSNLSASNIPLIAYYDRIALLTFTWGTVNWKLFICG